MRNRSSGSSCGQLEQRGVPEDVWLVEIELVRDALRQADRTLTRLHDALIRAAETGT
jgi:hypothetical protein